MRLILKSLFRTMRKRPLQPIILVITMSVAVAIAAFTFALHESLLEERGEAQAAEYGSADITVKLDGGSRSRFLFAQRAEELLPEGTRAVGAFELPLVTEDRSSTVLAAAVDFTDIGEIFSFSFSEYSTPSVKEVPDTVFISEDLANRMSLKLGDKLSVNVLGSRKSYTVRGISPTSFLGRYDALADISGVVEILVSDSAVLSSLGPDFKPFSTVYVDVPDGADKGEAIRILSQSEHFSDKTVEDVGERMKLVSNEESLSVIIKISVALSGLLAGAVVFSCLYVLSGERREANLILAAAGARPILLNATQYIEVIIYHILSSLIGIPLSVPIISLLSRYAGYVYCVPSLSLSVALRSIVLTLAVALVTVSVFILCRSHTRSVKHGKAERASLTLITLALALLFAVCAFVFPSRVSFVFYVLSTVFAIAALLLGVPLVLVRLFVFLDKRLSLKSGSVPLNYAVKNLASLRVLHNSTRLVALFLGVLLSVLALFSSAIGLTRTVDGLFPSELAVMNATDKCHTEVEKLESVDEAYQIYMAGVSVLNEDMFLISLDDTRALSDMLGIEELPLGNNAVISSGEAKKHSLSVGDTVALEVAGREISLVISEISPMGVGVILFDAEAFGISPNMLLVSGREGVSRAELIDDVTGAVKEELAPVVETEELFRARMRNIKVYIRATVILLSVLVLFAVIGLFDNLYESRSSRKEERELYLSAGMSDREIGKMRSIELCAVFGLGILMGALAAVFTTAVLTRGSLSFGYEFFINFKRAFGCL